MFKHLLLEHTDDNGNPSQRLPLSLLIDMHITRFEEANMGIGEGTTDEWRSDHSKLGVMKSEDLQFEQDNQGTEFTAEKRSRAASEVLSRKQARRSTILSSVDSRV